MSGSLTGRVFDTEGNPVENATVTIVDADTDETAATVTTNSSGDYSSGTIADGTYDVTADKRGYLSDTVTGQTVSGGTTSVPDLTIQAAIYKTRGKVTAFGYGVLGVAAGTSGEPVGVRGVVPNTNSGYGLSTPDDARIGGTMATSGAWRVDVEGDRGFRVGSAGTSTNGSGVPYTVGSSVVGGYEANTVNDALGATIGGGGAEETNNEFGILLAGPNEVTDQFGTVGGGAANQAGDAMSGTTNALYATVGGGLDNIAAGEGSTIGGGENNTASGDQAAIGGGFENSAGGPNSTVGGGFSNSAGAGKSTVAGGRQNIASGIESTVGGGRENTASGEEATVGGGQSNVASGTEATIGGGQENTASGQEATVGGGQANLAFGDHTTIAGGGGFFSGNEAHGGDSAIGGGQDNRTGKSGTGLGLGATVPGGQNNVAEGDYSFAAGYASEAIHNGAFVWSDSSLASVTSTGVDQFIVEAGGGVGIGTESPVTQLHVRDSVSDTGSQNLGRHVMAVQNTGSSNTNDVLGLELPNVTGPGQFHNFISFMDSSGTIGSVQGDGSGNVSFETSSADIAEYFPKADPDESFEDGEVVGLRDGEIVADPTDADLALVVSGTPMVVGNAPPEGQDEGFARLALLGQVAVTVAEPVDRGSLLVAGSDGRARPASADDEDAPVVGLALESGSSVIRTLVGRHSPMAGQQSADVDTRADGRLEALESENERLREENEALRDRLAAVESHLGIGGDATATPADD